MSDRADTIASSPWPRSLPAADLLFVGLVFVAYTLTLWVAKEPTLGGALRGGVANTIPVVVFGVIVRRVIIGRLIGRSILTQALGHAVLCAVFSFASYWLLIILLGAVYSASFFNFSVESFVSSGMAWQMLQNVTTYAVIAALVHGRARPAAETAPPMNEVLVAQSGSKEPSRYLLRVGDEIRPIEVDRICSISGADDYAKITTLDGKHLVSMTLSRFEAALDPARFLRVHRSRIVNLDFVEKAEPAGSGRLLLHMANGDSITTSRAGAGLLKSRAI